MAKHQLFSSKVPYGYLSDKQGDELAMPVVLGADPQAVFRPVFNKFDVLLLCRIMERSFSWLENFRRIAMDYEFYSDTGEAMI